MNKKQELGQFFTKVNPFTKHPIIKEWLRAVVKDGTTITEPFCGEGDLCRHLLSLNPTLSFTKYDIQPTLSTSAEIIQNDSIRNIPRCQVIITNPPYFQKTRAAKEGIDVSNWEYNDMYLDSLASCIRSSNHTLAIVPASFIVSGQLTEGLKYIVVITSKLFADTDVPVCTVIYEKGYVGECAVYDEGKDGFVSLSEIHRIRESLIEAGKTIKTGTGNVLVSCIDGSAGKRISFVENDYAHTQSKGYLVLEGDVNRIHEYNELLERLRAETNDNLLCTFRGITSAGRYRRRISFSLAKGIVGSTLHKFSL